MQVIADDLLHPLSYFRRNGGQSLPHYDVLDGSAMPEPYKSLLVHEGDMTSRLEAHHDGSIVLEVLHAEREDEIYRREVVLHLEKNGLPVEYGAIEIHLDAFDPKIRSLILEGHHPLGGLLNQFKVHYRSRPRAFFQMGPDVEMNALFSAMGANRFFGRSNELLGEDDRILARIVEVLRP